MKKLMIICLFLFGCKVETIQRVDGTCEVISSEEFHSDFNRDFRLFRTQHNRISVGLESNVVIGDTLCKYKNVYGDYIFGVVGKSRL